MEAGDLILWHSCSESWRVAARLGMGPAMDSSTKEPSVREQILAAAMKLVIENDGKEPSSREVARSADVTAAMINYHFTNREGLIQACVESYYTGIRTRLMDLVPLVGQMGLPKVIETAIRTTLPYMRENRPLARMVLLDFVRLGGMRDNPRTTEAPLVQVATKTFAGQLDLPETEVRYRIKSIILLCGRYVVVRDDELLRVSGCESLDEAWARLEDHIVGLAVGLLTKRSSTGEKSP